jgi:hypothetical protein
MTSTGCLSKRNVYAVFCIHVSEGSETKGMVKAALSENLFPQENESIRQPLASAERESLR